AFTPGQPCALPSPILRRLSSTSQRHAAPGSAWLRGALARQAAALWAARKSRAHSGAAGGGCGGGRRRRGGAKRPCEFPSMLPLLSSPLAYFSSLYSLGAVSPRPERSRGFLGRWHLASPTTCSPCGFQHPAPKSRCVV